MRCGFVLWLMGAVCLAAADGERIYREHCASCHGAGGEGVADEVDEPLYGAWSLEKLTRYVERRMPEDDEDLCVGEDAEAVSKWIYEEFYSAAARVRNDPPRVELVRLTNEQFRESVTDLVASFAGEAPVFEGGGLKGSYFNAEKMNEQKEKLLERVDGRMAFVQEDFEAVPKLNQDRFSVSWSGSLFAPDSGQYRFRLVTQNGARLYLNPAPAARGRQEEALIDGWVSLGDDPREEEGRAFLLGGRAYLVRLQYLSYKQKSSSFRFEWKPPEGVWEVVPAEYLSEKAVKPLLVVETSFPPDDASLGYERGTAVSREWHEAIVRAAVEVAGKLMPQIDRLARVGRDGKDRGAKIEQFCETFCERAFRRPLDDTTRERVVGQQFKGLDPEVAARRSIVLALCSPRFLYPSLSESEGASPDGYAVASRLALALWDSVPDGRLRKAAMAGRLSEPAEVEAQAARMIEDPRASHKLRGFFRHWLAMDEADRLAKDREAYPGFDEVLVADLRESLERFVEGVVWSEGSDYRQLLLADYLLVNRRMAAFYGLGDLEGEGFEMVKIEDGRRSGVFTHPYLLAAFSYHKSTSPIHRGVFLTRNILGRFLKPPPMAIEFMDDRFDPDLTMREKVTELTRQESCMACHVMINPLGFSLENYDAAGRWRDRDGGRPVDPVSDYLTSSGDVVKLRGARDLANHAATNREASTGFTRQLFQHTIKQAPGAYGANKLDELHRGFVDSGYHIRKLLLQVALVGATHEDPTTSASK